MSIKGALVAVAGVAFSLAVGSVEPALAGPYADELARCLVRSTTDDDKNYLVKWMFATAALHPAVKSIASVSDEQREELTRNAAKMFERLLGEACRAETRDAFKYEGPSTLEAGFQVLGQVAARRMFSDPSVAGNLADFGKYIDQKKLEGLLAPGR
jgi:hypothetical protein